MGYLRRDLVTCPRCQFKFSKSYARVTACRGCAVSVSTCPSIKCPRCSHEFPLA